MNPVAWIALAVLVLLIGIAMYIDWRDNLLGKRQVIKVVKNRGVIVGENCRNSKEADRSPQQEN